MLTGMLLGLLVIVALRAGTTPYDNGLDKFEDPWNWVG